MLKEMMCGFVACRHEKIKGSILGKPMRMLNKSNDYGAKRVFSPVARFGAQIPAVVAAVLSRYGSH
jgi:hypothetical protein